ncbi:hypothetical protein EVAR_61610_1 [Eumeta japonica]|uniref:Uncharacterized protein n=1 Tax=Eumeta variegata TaxID=151549 RepID=A0A4C1SER1_EUMVA|nr:hypothetical protein EVAR_61610_1 [Eumeta japonica]
MGTKRPRPRTGAYIYIIMWSNICAINWRPPMSEASLCATRSDVAPLEQSYGARYTKGSEIRPLTLECIAQARGAAATSEPARRWRRSVGALH